MATTATKEEPRLVRTARYLLSSYATRSFQQRKTMVGVGIAITRDPLRRSGQALLTHPAPALVVNAQTL
jgi:hypothetical protein